MRLIPITGSISISENELKEKFVRSSGPGGQNVNKVSSAVQLRFDVANSESLPQQVKDRILASGDARLTTSGEIVITAENNRTQEANRREAVNRLVALIRDATIVRKKRKPTKPTAGSVKRRLENKSRRSAIKRSRSSNILPE